VKYQIIILISSLSLILFHGCVVETVEQGSISEDQEMNQSDEIKAGEQVGEQAGEQAGEDIIAGMDQAGGDTPLDCLVDCSELTREALNQCREDDIYCFGSTFEQLGQCVHTQCNGGEDDLECLDACTLASENAVMACQINTNDCEGVDEIVAETCPLACEEEPNSEICKQSCFTQRENDLERCNGDVSCLSIIYQNIGVCLGTCDELPPMECEASCQLINDFVTEQCERGSESGTDCQEFVDYISNICLSDCGTPSMEQQCAEECGIGIGDEIDTCEESNDLLCMGEVLSNFGQCVYNCAEGEGELSCEDRCQWVLDYSVIGCSADTGMLCDQEIADLSFMQCISYCDSQDNPMSDLCTNFMYQLCTNSSECGEGYECNFENECVSSACSCDPQTGEILCLPDCAMNLGICFPIEM
jgi:hypothetical protein